MKKIILALALLISANAFSQDTTIVLNLALQARVMEYLTPYLKQRAVQTVLRNAEDPTISLDGSYNLFLKWRGKFQATQPTNLTTVSVDTTGVVILADMYNYALNNPDGIGAATLVKTQIASARAANTYLDRLCTAYEVAMAAVLVDMRKQGRRFLLGSLIVP